MIEQRKSSGACWLLYGLVALVAARLYSEHRPGQTPEQIARRKLIEELYRDDGRTGKPSTLPTLPAASIVPATKSMTDLATSRVEEQRR